VYCPPDRSAGSVTVSLRVRDLPAAIDTPTGA
jgi:hypothetical protein